MGLAAYAFHWTATEFWASTPHEFWSAFEVYQEANSDPDK